MAKKKKRTTIRKKIQRSVREGIAHIQSTFNNTIVTITDIANALPGFSRALTEEIENSKSVKQNSQ